MAVCVKWIPRDGGQQCTVVYSEFPVFDSPEQVAQYVGAVTLLFVAVFVWRLLRHVL
jgi:hypothetical protein